MSKETFVKFVNRAMMASVVFERAHSMLRRYSPKYSDWADEKWRQVRKKAGFYYTLDDAIRGYLDLSEDDEVGSGYFGLNNLQVSSLAIHLFQTINVEKVLLPRLPADALSIESIGLSADTGATRDIRDCAYSDDGPIKSREYATPDDVLSADGSRPASIPYNGYRPYSITFARYKGHKIVLQLIDSVRLHYCCRPDDLDNLKEFVDSVAAVVQHESLLKGLVCSFGEPQLSFQSSNVIGTKITESQKKSDPIHTLIDLYNSSSQQIRLDKKASMDLRGLKKIEHALFSDEINNFLQRDLPGFITQMDQLCAEGYDARRSYLLEGPPGTGKSYIIKAIVSSLPKNFTTILIEKNSINRLLQIASYSFLFPALVVIEDVDLLLDDRERLQTLLNFLDGVFAPQKMITIMTSNCLNDISDSIKARPGRVDRIINVGPGTFSMRKAQLTSLTSTLKKLVPIDEIAEKTEGLTVSHLRELIRRARIYTKNFNGEIDPEALQAVLKEYVCGSQSDQQTK